MQHAFYDFTFLFELSTNSLWCRRSLAGGSEISLYCVPMFMFWDKYTLALELIAILI
jgi:hypothetical protein